jgi:hypothetical protein
VLFPDPLLADDPLTDVRVTHVAAGERHVAKHRGSFTSPERLAVSTSGSRTSSMSALVIGV